MKIKAGKSESQETLTPSDAIKIALFGDTDTSDQIESFKVISTGLPTLDKMLGGGVIVGGVVEIAGLEATGKSTLVAMIGAEAQKLNYPVVYIDTECAASKKRLASLGMNIDDMIYVQPNCLEDVYETVTTILKAKLMDKKISSPILIIFDSLAGTPAKKEVEGDEYDKEMAIRARVNSAALRKITKPLVDAEATLLIVNQFRESVGQMFGDKFNTPGGHAVKYAAIQRIRLSSAGKEKLLIDGQEIEGKKVNFKSIKNKIHQPLLETVAIFNNSTGTFEIIQTMFEELKTRGFIRSSGPTWKLELGEEEISFKRAEWPEVYEANKEAIYKVL